MMRLIFWSLVVLVASNLVACRSSTGKSPSGGLLNPVASGTKTSIKFKSTPKTGATAKTARKPAPPAKPLVTPAGSGTSRIASVNLDGRFAVVALPNGVSARVDQRLQVYRGDRMIAELKVTGPQRDNLTVADIIAGACEAGDEVREP